MLLNCKTPNTRRCRVRTICVKTPPPVKWPCGLFCIDQVDFAIGIDRHRDHKTQKRGLRAPSRTTLGRLGNTIIAQIFCAVCLCNLHLVQITTTIQSWFHSCQLQSTLPPCRCSSPKRTSCSVQICAKNYDSDGGGELSFCQPRNCLNIQRSAATLGWGRARKIISFFISATMQHYSELRSEQWNSDRHRQLTINLAHSAVHCLMWSLGFSSLGVQRKRRSCKEDNHGTTIGEKV